MISNKGECGIRVVTTPSDYSCNLFSHKETLECKPSINLSVVSVVHMADTESGNNDD